MPDEKLIRCSSCGQVNRVNEKKLGLGLQPKCGRCKQPLVLSNSPTSLSDSTFFDLIEKSTVPVLVDFWAPWCGPCHAMAPVIEQLAAEYAGRIDFVKLNTDTNPRTAARYGVMGLPTLLLFRAGQAAGRLVRVQPKATITRALR